MNNVQRIHSLEEEIRKEIHTGASAVAAYVRSMSRSHEHRAGMIGMLRRLGDEAEEGGHARQAVMLRKAVCLLMLDG